MNKHQAKDLICPICGYYCLGQGASGCIDKPTLVEAAENQEINVTSAIRILRTLTPELRMQVLGEFCTYCGSTDPRCVCMRDD